MHKREKQKDVRSSSDETLLIIKPGAIGDVLHMTPVIRAVKKNRPNSKLLFLAGSKVTSEILLYNPYLDEVIIFKKGRGVREFARIYDLSRSLKKKGQFDWILNYQPSNWRWRLLTLLLKPKGVLKYRKQKGLKKGGKIRHAIEDHLAVLAGLDIREESLKLDFFLSETEIKEGGELIDSLKDKKSVKGVIGLNLGASHTVNRWPLSSFNKLDYILRSAGFKTILLGGPEDRTLAEEFYRFGSSDALDLIGNISIRQTGAVIRHCDVLVSGDTGPLHLAASVGTKVIGLYGAADPERTGPVGSKNIVIQAALPCVPCRKRRCKLDRQSKINCMKNITPEEVAVKIADLIPENNH